MRHTFIKNISSLILLFAVMSCGQTEDQVTQNGKVGRTNNLDSVSISSSTGTEDKSIDVAKIELAGSGGAGETGSEARDKWAIDSMADGLLEERGDSYDDLADDYSEAAVEADRLVIVMREVDEAMSDYRSTAVKPQSFVASQSLERALTAVEAAMSDDVAKIELAGSGGAEGAGSEAREELTIDNMTDGLFEERSDSYDDYSEAVVEADRLVIVMREVDGAMSDYRSTVVKPQSFVASESLERAVAAVEAAMPLEY
jgi:hypothetical protein